MLRKVVNKHDDICENRKIVVEKLPTSARLNVLKVLGIYEIDLLINEVTMYKEDLIILKKRISELSENESKQRDLYLKQLSDGTLLGPMTGYVSIDKPWLKYHSDDAIKTVFEPMSAYDLVYKCNANHLDEVMMEYFGNKISYKNFFYRVDTVAKSLLEMGVSENDVVMAALPNTPEAAYIFYATNKIGAYFNVIDPRYSKDSFNESVEEANNEALANGGKVKVFFAMPDILNNLDEIDSEIQIISVSPTESFTIPLKFFSYLKRNKCERGCVKYKKWSEFLKVGNSSSIKNVESKYVPNKGNIICHTGGSTGTPKGVVLTNENFNGLAYQLMINNVGLERGRTFLNILPPFVAMGLDDGLHVAACAGLVQNIIPAVEPSSFGDLIARYKSEIILCGPVHCNMMMKNEKLKNMDLSFIKLIMYGGGSYDIGSQNAFNDFLREHNANIKVYNGYGATETASGSSCQKDSCYKIGSSGAPYIGVNYAVYNPDTSEELYDYNNKIGELLISGVTVMERYYGKRSYETCEAIYTDEVGVRYYKSRDLGHFENGMLYIDGRIKRIITRSAFKMYPEHMENLIMTSQVAVYIDEIAIVGVSDFDEIEIPVANIVLKDEYRNNSEICEEIENVCDKILSENISENAILAGYNYWSTTLPKTGIGKLDFKTLERIGIADNKQKRLKKEYIY